MYCSCKWLSRKELKSRICKGGLLLIIRTLGTRTHMSSAVIGADVMFTSRVRTGPSRYKGLLCPSRGLCIVHRRLIGKTALSLLTLRHPLTDKCPLSRLRRLVALFFFVRRTSVPAPFLVGRRRASLTMNCELMLTA
jgi:hypothetical protein